MRTHTCGCSFLLSKNNYLSLPIYLFYYSVCIVILLMNNYFIIIIIIIIKLYYIVYLTYTIAMYIHDYNRQVKNIMCIRIHNYTITNIHEMYTYRYV